MMLIVFDVSDHDGDNVGNDGDDDGDGHGDGGRDGASGAVAHAVAVALVVVVLVVLLPMAWMSSNEGSKSRLAGLMIQQAGASKEGFRNTSERIRELSGEGYEDLKDRISRRGPSISELLE